MADLIESDEFWQPCKAAEGERERRPLDRGVEDGEPIYDNCNEIRRTINALLQTGRMTQTAQVKLVGGSSPSYQTFMKHSGPYGGCNSCLYPRAARFFESLRLVEHRPKSAKRLKAEAMFGRYGLYGLLRI